MVQADRDDRRAHRGGSSPVAFAPTGPSSRPASEDGTARIWDARDGKLHADAPGPRGRGHDGGVLARRHEARHRRAGRQPRSLWQVDSGKLIAGARRAHRAHHTRWCSRPTGRARASPPAADATRAPLGRDGRQAHRRARRARRRGGAGDFSARRQAAWRPASWDGTARLWDAKDGKPLAHVLRPDRGRLLGGLRRRTESASPSRAGTARSASSRDVRRPAPPGVPRAPQRAPRSRRSRTPASPSRSAREGVPGQGRPRRGVRIDASRHAGAPRRPSDAGRTPPGEERAVSRCRPRAPQGDWY